MAAYGAGMAGQGQKAARPDGDAPLVVIGQAGVGPAGRCCLEFWTSCNEGLAGFVVLELLEVVDEHFSKFGCLNSPFFGVGVGVAGIKDLGIYAGELGGNCEVEDRNLLGGSGKDGAVEDGVDDTAGVTDGDTFAGTVPASVHQICLGTALFHLLHEFFCVLGGVQAQEGCAEASREGGGGLCDAALCAGQFRGEAAQEVVFGLLGCQDRNRGEHAECVSAQEDNVLGGGAVATRGDLLDEVDGVAYAGVLCNALVGEVDFTFFVDGYVLEEGVATDGVVDVGLALFVEVDNLGVAAAFVVEHAVVVPAVFVVTDEQTFGVGGQGGLTCTAEAEEDGGVLALHVGVCGAVHGGHAAEGEVVVHDREHTFLHLTAVPCVDDHLHALCEVEGNASLAVDAEFFPVFNFCLGGVENHEVGG